MTHRSRLLGTFLAVVIMVASALLGFGLVAAPSGAGSHDGNASSGLGTATCTYPTVTDVETAASATYSSTPLTVVFYPVTPGDVFVVSAESQYSVTFTLSDAVDFFTLDTQVAIGWTNWYTWNATTSQTGYVTLTLTPSGSTSAAMIAWDVTPLGPVSVSVGAVGQGGASVSSSASSGSCGLALGDWAVLNAAAGYVTSPSGWSSGSSSATTSAGDSIGGNWTYVGAGGTVTFDPTFSYTALHYNYAQVVTLAGPAPPLAPTVSTVTVSNSEIDLVWNESSALTGSDYATLDQYAGASCSGGPAAINVATGNWGFYNFTALVPATAYSFTVTVTDANGTSPASACEAATTSAQTSAPFGAIAQGNTIISLPTAAGDRIILGQGMADTLPSDSQGNVWAQTVDGNTGLSAIWTTVTATTGNDVITTGVNPPSDPYTGGWAVAVSGVLKTILASGQGDNSDPYLNTYWARLPVQTENSVVLFTESTSGTQNASCQFTVPLGWRAGCTPILSGNWRFPLFTLNVSAGTAPVISGNLTPYGNTVNSDYSKAFDFPWVELAWPTPPAPTGLTATAVSSSEIDLAFTNPVGPLTDNHAYQFAGGSCAGSPISYDQGDVQTLIDVTSLAPSTTYSFEVTASNVSGEGPPSNCAYATTFSVPHVPSTPTNLVATVVSGTEIDLAWTNPAGPLTDNHLYAYAGLSCGVSLSVTDFGMVTTASDQGALTTGNDYSYEVTASNTNGESSPSNCAYATTFGVPSAPTGLVATAVSGTEIDLVWTNPAGPLTHSTVYEYYNQMHCQSIRLPSEPGSEGSLIGALTSIAYSGTVIDSFSVTGLLPLTLYGFEVTANNSTGESLPSNCASTSTFSIEPSLTITNITDDSFDETWSNGSWGNVTYAVLFLSNTSASCSLSGIYNVWTWEVGLGSGSYIPQSGTVDYEFNISLALNFTFAPQSTVWVCVVYNTNGAGGGVFITAPQNVTFGSIIPPPPPVSYIDPLLIIIVGASLSFALYIVYVYWRRRHKQWTK